MSEWEREREVTTDQFGRLLSYNVGWGDPWVVKVLIEQITINTHRTTQQMIMKFVVALIRAWAKQHREGRFDGRNESTVRLCSKLEQCVDESGEYLPLI